MGPAADHGDILAQIVVSGIAIRMEVALEPLQKCLRMRCTPSGLVFVQDNGLIRIPTGPVQPHIAFALGLFVRFVKYLQGCFIRMEDISLEKFLVQLFVDRLQVILC